MDAERARRDRRCVPPERSPPGKSFAYSSTNYIVLGLIAEEAGGAPLGRQLRALFLPLGLRRTSFINGEIRGSRTRASAAVAPGVVAGLPLTRAPSPHGGRGPPAHRLDRGRRPALLRCPLAWKSARPTASARDGDARAAGRRDTASESPPSRHHASLPGAIRETSRARSPSRGTRKTRRVSSSSS